MHVCVGKGCKFRQQHPSLPERVCGRKLTIGFLTRIKYQGEEGGVSHLSLIGVPLATVYESNCTQATVSYSARFWI